MGVMFTFTQGTKFYHHYAEAEDMIQVARILITTKPKRGWVFAHAEIKEAEQLEMELFEKCKWN